MAKCVPYCIYCSKFETMKCHRVAQISRTKQLVQGAYPWNCLFNRYDK